MRSVVSSGPYVAGQVSEHLRRFIDAEFKQNNPLTLFVADPDFFDRCAAEGDHDIRHLGRDLWFEYLCPNCGPKIVHLPPDYPYCGANVTWTCDHCAAVMRLRSSEPVRGVPKACMTTFIRSCS